MKISLLGLTGSGKTCYLYAAAQVLARGVSVNGHKISVTPSNRQQAVRLHRGIEQMARGKWPDGSMNTLTYPFELKIDGKSVFPFTIYDYRGSMLDGLSDDDQDDTEEIFETFRESSCIVILVDGDTIMDALDTDCIALEHNRRTSFANQLFARNKLNYIELLVRECNMRMGNNVPVLLAITKRDIFFDDELDAGKELLKEFLPSLFSRRNDMIVGITAVSLGEDLHNENGVLTGTLCLNTDGNVHLPLLFALFQDIESIGDDVDEAKRLILKLFSSDRISFYRGGEEAFIV